ncbi:MAG: hypothetical protein LBP75_03210 [Planctomycetota bacterium]|jgi:hypothetical protein|nr:hypothetical protein [Planctomycetota bacterium]
MGPFDNQQNPTGNQYPEIDGFTEIKRGKKLPDECADGFMDNRQEVEIDED